MRHSYLALLALCSTYLASAQITHDSVSTNAGNTDQVWYSLESGNKQTSSLNSWHLAFQISGISSSILFNSAAGHTLYTYPAGNIDDWHKVDTNGMGTWTGIYNADTSWASGAFNMHIDANDPFDLGWGIYDLTTHNVVGDSFYIVKMASGSFLKLQLEKLANAEYSFKYADLDGKNEKSGIIKKSDHDGKNFGYFNLETNKSVEVEPLSKDWDVLFTKYTTQIPIGPSQFMPYGVSGVLSNSGTTVNKIYPVNDPETYDDYSVINPNTEINTIGYNWKSYDFGTNSYIIEDSTVFLCQTAAGDIWKLVMTGYGGTTSGQFNFYKEKLFATNIEGVTEPLNAFGVYPNPVSGTTINLATSVKTQGATLRLISVSGSLILEKQMSKGNQLQNIWIADLDKGVYFMTLTDSNSTVTKKIIVE